MAVQVCPITKYIFKSLQIYHRVAVGELLDVIEALQLPGHIVTSSWFTFDPVEALALTLAQFCTSGDEFELSLLYPALIDLCQLQPHQSHLSHLCTKTLTSQERLIWFLNSLTNQFGMLNRSRVQRYRSFGCLVHRHNTYHSLSVSAFWEFSHLLCSNRSHLQSIPLGTPLGHIRGLPFQISN